MSVKAILAQFNHWRAERRRLVLATVVETEGSTYSKAGHRILISDDGHWQGLVSGGCLEGDLAAHAHDVLDSQRPRCVHYDMRREEDSVFGMATGCDGMIRVLLQPLEPAGDYEPYARIEAIHLGDEGARCLTVYGGTADGPAPGTTVFTGPMGVVACGTDAATAAALEAAATTPGHHDVMLAGGRCRVLHTRVEPLPRLLVLGAGADAAPLAVMASHLGWRVTLYDHRQTALSRATPPVAERVLTAPISDLERHVTLRHCAAAVVMTHQLTSDLACLAHLARSPVPYIGLVGPPPRRQRLLDALGSAADGLEGRVFGPAGLDIGADSPESIALSILAEIHARRSHRQGTPLSR